MGVIDDQRQQLIDGFQETMTAFLETQRAVMLAFLDADRVPDGHPSGEGAEPVPDAPVAHPPAAEPVEFVAPLPDLTRLNGETAVGEGTRSGPEAGAGGVAEASPADSFDAIVATLLGIVEDRTGYPPETLDLDLRMEADLGMDSIKRVEIIGTLQRTLSPGKAVDPAAMDQLTKARTLRALAEGFAGPGLARSHAGRPDRDDADQEVDRAAV